jgi:predicted molibdopterin-dependent oxidoreductase YjgC
LGYTLVAGSWAAARACFSSDSPRRETSGAFVTTSWRQALDPYTDNFKRIQRKPGPDAIAVLITGQIVM